MKREIQRLIAAAGLGALVLLIMLGAQMTEWQYIATKALPDNLQRPWVCRAQCVASDDSQLCSSDLIDGECESLWHLRQASLSECRAWTEQSCEGINSEGELAIGVIAEPSLIELAAPLSER